MSTIEKVPGTPGRQNGSKHRFCRFVMTPDGKRYAWYYEFLQTQPHPWQQRRLNRRRNKVARASRKANR